MTTCLRFINRKLSATRAGSFRSRVAGRPVLTLQKPQLRVQVSPRIIIVAEPRLQHSPMFGQLASWQTVCSLCSSMIAFRRRYSSPPGTRARSQSGFFPILKLWRASSPLFNMNSERLTVGKGRFLAVSPPSGFGCRARVRSFADFGVVTDQ